MQEIRGLHTDKYCWRVSAVLVGIQLLLTAVVVVLDWAGATDWIVVAASHFLLATENHQLKQWYPNHYHQIYLIAQFIRFGLPILLLTGFTYLHFVRKLERVTFLELWRYWTLDWPQLYLPLLMSFSFLLLCYLGLRPFVSKAFEVQLLFTRIFLLVAVLHVCFLLLANGRKVWAGLSNFLLKPEMPHSLAITRILFFLFLAHTYISYRAEHSETIGKLDKVALPFIGWLIDLIPVNPQIYSTMCLAGVVCALFIVVGYHTRIFLIVNSIIVFYVVAAPNFFGKLWHNQLIIWISWIMAFSSCADILSIDARRSSFRLDSNSSSYGFHLKVIWLHFGLIYFFAGVHKLSLCGLDWALTDSMISQVQIEWFEHYDRVPAFRIDRWPLLLMAGGLAVIVFEILYPFLLFGKRLRWISIIGGLSMHQALGRIMYISFEQLQTAYLVFIPWNRILKRIRLIGQTEPCTSVVDWRSARIIVPMLILAVNFLFGVFIINSYPFSVYPVYAEIVPPTVKYLDYRILDSGKQHLDFRDEGRKHGFRWESYSRLEYHAIRKYQAAGELDTLGVVNQWKRWQLGTPSLGSIDSVDVYVIGRAVHPDSSQVQHSEEYLMTIGS